MSFFRLGRKQDPVQSLASVLAGQDVPMFRRAVVEVLRLLRDSETEPGSIAEALQWDPGIVVRVLRTVNSAAYAPKRTIESVPHAVSYLGRAKLEQIVVVIAVKETLPAAPVRGFDPKRYWRAAAYRGSLSRLLATRLHPSRETEAFTIGLLQDMAIPVLAGARPDYGEVLEDWHANLDVGLADLERSAFGWSHAEVGGVLGEVWGLPPVVAEGIALHHDSSSTDGDLLPSVRLVGVLHETQLEHGLEGMIEVARTDYGLDADWTAESAREAEQRAAELADLLA
jgi:HD-like signal output (HDOD) protein